MRKFIAFSTILCSNELSKGGDILKEDKLGDLSIVKVKYKNKIVYVLFDNDESTIYKKDGEIILSTTKENFDVFSINRDTDCYFDYDNISSENPINADDVLNKWNFLHDIATAFGMHFEGNEQKHTRAYVDWYGFA